jgi:hypothetical protein
MPKIAKDKNYLNKNVLLREIYKSREQDELTPEALKMLMLLAKKLIRKLYYKCDDDRENALSEAYYDIVKNWRNFNPDYAKLAGYDDLQKGDEVRIFIDDEKIKTAGATVIENYPERGETLCSVIIKKNQREEQIVKKVDMIVKEPNPFSFFTSTCINGFAKGWKELYPKKSKGKLISLDSGYGSSDTDGMHSL